MDQNSQKGSQNKAIIHYHLLWKSPFDVLLNSFIIWISDKEASRIIQSHHVTYTNERFFLTACRNTAAYCIIFLTVWNSWLRQQISRIRSVYKVSLSFCFNDEGKQPVKKKAECFKAWRRFYFHHYTFQIRVTDQAWGQYDRIFGQIPFETKSRPISSYLDRTSLVNRIYFMAKLSWFLFTTVCLAVDLIFYEKPGYQDTDLCHFVAFPSSVHCVNAKRSHGPLCDNIARSRFFRSPNTLETPRNEAVSLIISSTDILKTNLNLLSMRCVDKIPAWPV